MNNFLGVEELNITNQINYEQMEELKDLLMAPNVIKEINFINVDADILEYFKYVMELSPYINDININKNIYGFIDEKMIKNKYLNPETWYAAFKEEDDVVYFTKITNYKKYLDKITSTLNYLKANKASDLDIIKVFYDEVKSLKHGQKEGELESFISKDTKSHNKVFNYVLKTLGFSTILSEDNYVLVKITDENYDIDGVYLFNPEKDHRIGKYSLISYDYFALNPSNVETELMNSFKIRNLSYLKNHFSNYTNMEKEAYFDLYKDILFSKDLSEENKIKCITKFNNIDQKIEKDYILLVYLNYLKKPKNKAKNIAIF